MAVIGLFVGFLVQVIGGSSNLLQALGVAGGIVLTQGVLTRQQVFSPKDHRPGPAQLHSGVAGLIAPSSSMRAVRNAVQGSRCGARRPGRQQPACRCARRDGSGRGVRTRRLTPIQLLWRLPRPSRHPGQRLPCRPPLPTRRRNPRSTPRCSATGLRSATTPWRATTPTRLRSSSITRENVLRSQDGTVIAAAAPADAGTSRLTLEFGPGGATSTQSARNANRLPRGGQRRLRRPGARDAPASGLRRPRPRPRRRRQVRRPVVAVLAVHVLLRPRVPGARNPPGPLRDYLELRLDANDQPDDASHSQHRSGLQATGPARARLHAGMARAPITYSARGSHANLLRSGIQVSARSFLPDHNDGRADACALS